MVGMKGREDKFVLFVLFVLFSGFLMLFGVVFVLGYVSLYIGSLSYLLHMQKKGYLEEII